jgi:hypothetical protein
MAAVVAIAGAGNGAVAGGGIALPEAESFPGPGPSSRGVRAASASIFGSFLGASTGIFWALGESGAWEGRGVWSVMGFGVAGASGPSLRSGFEAPGASVFKKASASASEMELEALWTGRPWARSRAISSLLVLPRRLDN